MPITPNNTPASFQPDGPVLGLIQAYMQAWNNHDSYAAGTYLADDVRFYDASVGVTVEGRSRATLEVINAFIEAMPNLRWMMTSEPVYNDNTIAFQWQFSGRHEGIWDGKPATHKEIVFDGVSFIKINQGKICYQGDYYDSRKLSEQLESLD